MILRKSKFLVCLFLSIIYASANADLPREKVCELFSQANQYFRQANSARDPEQADKLYENAILSFDRIIDEGGIHNAKLYYNLANAYLLRGRLGKAILNYRRAANLGNDDDIRKNLTFARSQRKDQVTIKTEKRVLQTLFFWHYDFGPKTKVLLVCIFFGIVCCSGIVMLWANRSAPVIATAVIFGFLTLCFFTSVIIQARADANNISGVITVEEVVAYQGDGRNYPPSFKEPLHEGTEFDLLEQRPGWFHIILSDDNQGWIPDNAAELI